MLQGHGNFIEYAPIFLILLALGEIQNLGMLVPLSAVAFVISRSFHGAVFFFKAHKKFRFYGMLLNMTAIASLAVANMMLGFARIKK